MHGADTIRTGGQPARGSALREARPGGTPTEGRWARWARGAEDALGSPTERSRVIARLYHFSAAGLAYAATTCVLVVGAVNGQNNLLFWLFGLAVGGLIVSGVLSGWSLMGVRVERRIVPGTHAGGTLRVVYTITNRNRVFGAFGLVVEELSSARSYLGRSVLADYPSRVGAVGVYVPYVGPRKTVVVEASAPALARGAVTFAAMRVSSSFPLGLTRKSVTFEQPARAVILPAVAHLSPAARARARGDLSKAGRPVVRTAGSEFYSLRPFSTGDSVRRIAWRATARLDDPVVRVTADRPGGRVWLVLDDPPSGGASEGEARAMEFERGVVLACALGREMLRGGAAVGVRTAGGGTVLLPAHSPSQADRLMHELALLGAEELARGESDPVGHAGERGGASTSQVRITTQGGEAREGPEHAALSPLDAGLYDDGRLPEVALPRRDGSVASPLRRWTDRVVATLGTLVRGPGSGGGGRE